MPSLAQEINDSIMQALENNLEVIEITA